MSAVRYITVLAGVLVMALGAWAQEPAPEQPAAEAQAEEEAASSEAAEEAAPAETVEEADAPEGDVVEETGAGAEEMDKAAEMETARKDFGMVKKADGEGIVIGVTPIDTFLEVKPLMRKMLLMNGGDVWTKSADRFGVYLQGYLASLEGLSLADLDEERLKAVMGEIEAGQLGAREGEKENKWMGVDAFVGGAYGMSKIEKMGFVPLKHVRLRVSVAETGETFEHVSLPPYSTSGSSDPLMAYYAAKDLRDLVDATPEQRELIRQITLVSQKRQFVKAAGWILQLLAGVEYLAAGYVADTWENRAKDANDNSNGYTITKYACYAMGGLAIVSSPINPIMAAIHRAKEKKLKKQYNEKYGQRYSLK